MWRSRSNLLFETENGLGLDPLAHYSKLFPAWQGRVPTVTAAGECMPLRDGSFDLVLCDNVVDHAKDPRRILEEIARVLRPGEFSILKSIYITRFITPWHRCTQLGERLE